MARRPLIDHVLISFRREVNAAQALEAAISQIPTAVNPQTTQPSLHPKQRLQVVELAFIGVVGAWEEFLERTLVRYLAGASSASGSSTSPKYGSANSILHAYQVLSQRANYDPSRHFLKANDPDWILSTADFHFHSHPYSVIQPHLELLKQGVKIRNRIAHASQKCRTEFKSTALTMLGSRGVKLRQGYSPGDLLLTPLAGGQIGVFNAGKASNHFEGFLALYLNLANQVAA